MISKNLETIILESGNSCKKNYFYETVQELKCQDAKLIIGNMCVDSKKLTFFEILLTVRLKDAQYIVKRYLKNGLTYLCHNVWKFFYEKMVSR